VNGDAESWIHLKECAGAEISMVMGQIRGPSQSHGCPIGCGELSCV
jgi:hypothetical protein